MYFPSMMNWTIYALVGLSLVLGLGSLITFGVFLYTGSFSLVALSLDATQVLIFDACLCLAFILQHSGMIRVHARKEILGKNFAVAFSMASGIVLFSLIALWQESPFLIASADGFFRGLLRAIFFLGIAGQIWSSMSLTSAIDPFGVQGLMARIKPTTGIDSDADTDEDADKDASTDPAPATLVLATGAYAWVRHPAYSTTLLLLWSYPDLTADRLLLNVVFTVWVIVGAILEERGLVEAFGEDYRAYQRTVPMLIPYRRPKCSNDCAKDGSSG
uniref:Uncharacterized protein n=1 Tax=Candidatus Kentrum sp. LFY TaxID=2126342 RepID=A0A450UQI6_9GAMM|nr:MAG: Protein of unknown function (DUF1295) [Candidatus Kentron sp. LFY]